MEIIKKIATNNPCYKNNRIINPKGIMIHSVGVSQPDPKVFVRTLNNEASKVCVHAFVGTDEIYQILPWNRRAWHCAGDANNTHISVELTEPNTITYVGGSSWVDKNASSTKAFVLKIYQNAVFLFAEICKEYGLNPLEDGVIISHSEGYKRKIASNHGDVEHIWNKFGLTTEQFRLDIKAKMEEEEYMILEKSFLVNGDEKVVNTIFKDGKNYVEVRGLCEALKVEVQYNQEDNKISLTNSIDVIKIRVNGVTKNVSRIFIKDNNFVKLRDLADDKIIVGYVKEEGLPTIDSN